MMKSVRIPVMAAAASLLAAPGVLAGSGVLNADVPFNFVVADRHLPSGEYRFVQGEDPGVVRIYSKTQGPWPPCSASACLPPRRRAGRSSSTSTAASAS